LRTVLFTRPQACTQQFDRILMALLQAGSNRRAADSEAIRSCFALLIERQVPQVFLRTLGQLLAGTLKVDQRPCSEAMRLMGIEILEKQAVEVPQIREYLASTVTPMREIVLELLQCSGAWAPSSVDCAAATSLLRRASARGLHALFLRETRAFLAAAAALDQTPRDALCSLLTHLVPELSASLALHGPLHSSNAAAYSRGRMQPSPGASLAVNAPGPHDLPVNMTMRRNSGPATNYGDFSGGGGMKPENIDTLHAAHTRWNTEPPRWNTEAADANFPPNLRRYSGTGLGTYREGIGVSGMSALSQSRGELNPPATTAWRNPSQPRNLSQPLDNLTESVGSAPAPQPHQLITKCNPNTNFGDDTNFGDTVKLHTDTHAQSAPSSSSPAISVLLTHCGPTTQRATLRALALAARTEGRQAWEKHFGPVLILVLDSLMQRDLPGVRDTGLLCLQELVAHQSVFFNDIATVVASKLFETYRSSGPSEKQTVASIDRTLERLVAVIEPIRALEILLPVISEEGVPLLQAATRLLSGVLQRMSPEEVKNHLDAVLPGVIAAFGNPNSEVRKAAVFCLVDIYMILGEHVIPHLVKDLTPSQMKLVTIYISRQQREREGLGFDPPPAG